MSKVLNKIRKLLELANSDNEHEAALAAARARELILKHNVDEAVLAAAGGDIQAEPVEPGQMDSYRGRIPRWHVLLAQALQEAFMCSVFFIPGSEIVVIGRTSNRQALGYTWRYLRAQVQRLADEKWARKVERHVGYGFTVGRGDASRWKRGFCHGAAEVVMERMAREKAALPAGSSTAIVIHDRLAEVNKYVEENLNLRMVKTEQPSSGYHEGRSAGYELNLATAEEAHALAEGPKRLTA